MIYSYSKFYYGFDITPENQWLDIIEGSGTEISAEIQVGSYTPTQVCIELKIALDAAGDLTYTVDFNRVTRRITISATGPFKILGADGSHDETNVQTLLGFSQVQTVSATSHTGAVAAGDSFSPQLYLQEYVSTSDFQEAVDSKVNTTATGRVEVVKFGTAKFMKCNIKAQTSIAQPAGSHLRNDPQGEENLRRFMQYAVTKGPLEFMEDENAPEIFETMILESTPSNTSGVGYELKEMYDVGHNDYFQTGSLKFRKIED